MKNKTKTFLIAMIALATLAIAIVSAQQASYTITGDKVYIDDSNVYIEISPHTVTDPGYVEGIIHSKTFSGDFNAVFGFNTETTKPQSIDLYDPHTITEQKSKTCDTTKQGVWYNYTSNHAWCWKDVTNTNTTNTTTILLWEHDFDTADQETDTIYWEETKTANWKDISNHFNNVNLNYGNKDTWYYAENIPITEGQDIKFRFYLDVEFNTQGKYDFAIYPSKYGTTKQGIQQAIQDGNFYMIDPWWNSSWQYSQAIDISNTMNEDIPEYQIKLNLNSSNVGNHFNWSNNGADIRFLDDSNQTVYPHWIENWDSGNQEATIWVRLLDNITANSNTTMYLYYDNPQASTTSDKDEVYDFIDEFSGSSLDTNKWIIDTQSGGSSYSVGNGVLHMDSNCGIECDLRIVSEAISMPGEIIMEMNLSAPGNQNWLQTFVKKNSDDSTMIGASHGNDNQDSHRRYWDGGSNTDFTNVVGSTYEEIHFIYETDKNTWKDITSSITKTQTLTNELNQFYIWLRAGDIYDKNNQLKYDYIKVRRYAETEPTTTIQGEVKINLAPSLTTPTRYPTGEIKTTDDVNWTTTYTDPDNDTATIIFSHYVNNILTFNETFMNIANGTTISSALGSGNYTGSDQVNVTINASDGGLTAEVTGNFTVTPYGDEITGRTAIEQGIQNALSKNADGTDRRIYVRRSDDTQETGTFDKYVESGSKRYAFNYVSENESFTNIANMTPVLYIWEATNLTSSEIESQVENFITG